MNYELIESDTGVPIKAWTKGVQVEEAARQQLLNVARMPFIYRWIAAMPDVHWGMGATVGSVIPTKRAIIPQPMSTPTAAGMMALRTTLNASQLPDDLKTIRTAIERAVPHGRTDHGGRNDRGAWKNAPSRQIEIWTGLAPRYEEIVRKHPKLGRGNDLNHLGTLGTGNHFIEMCLDEDAQVWLLLPRTPEQGMQRFRDHLQRLYAAKALKLIPPTADELTLRPVHDGRLIDCLTPLGAPALRTQNADPALGNAAWPIRLAMVEGKIYVLR